MITKIRKNLYLGDSLSCLSFERPNTELDLSNWKFDLEPMKNETQRKEIWGCIYMILNAMDSDLPILVKCHGGIDRSPFIVSCALFVENFFDTYHKDDYPRHYQVAMSFYELVKSVHPATFIHDDWMKWFTSKDMTVVDEVR